MKGWSTFYPFLPKDSEFFFYKINYDKKKPQTGGFMPKFLFILGPTVFLWELRTKQQKTFTKIFINNRTLDIFSIFYCQKYEYKTLVLMYPATAIAVADPL